MKRISVTIAGLALAVGLGACNVPPQLQRLHFTSTTSTTTCPTDGSTFAYGSCVVPAGVYDAPAGVVETGAPSQISDPVGCGLQVVPAGYTASGTYVCQPTP
jgi:hypothetical protein